MKTMAFVKFGGTNAFFGQKVSNFVVFHVSCLRMV
jgi:hypothetical protein